MPLCACSVVVCRGEHGYGSSNELELLEIMLVSWAEELRVRWGNEMALSMESLACCLFAGSSAGLHSCQQLTATATST